MPGKKSFFGFILTSLLTVRLAADCLPAVVVEVPPAACKSGSATAAVVGVPGATYAWTVAGGQIVGDAAGDRITIALGTNATATVSVSMTSGGCVSSGSAVITLHDPFGIRVGAIPTGHASEPLTIVWAYDNGAPAQQTISGGDIGIVTLASDVRSYTYTPLTSGSKQIVFDAGMAMPPNTPPATSRRRSVAKTPASASSCALVHTSMPYTVSECIEPAVVIDAPDSVLTGTTFQLNVRPQPGAVATWTILNGSPATATGESVMVTAGSSGNVDVSVRLTRGTCAGHLDRSIAITAQPVCNNPTATVSAGPVSCGTGIVNAVFTGTPPFQGVWSDGVPFSSNATALARTVTFPGNYSILTFVDAACSGTSSGVAVLPALRPTATVVGKANSCVGADTFTVQFAGKPPFSGCWLDDSCFVTNDMQIVKAVTLEGTNTLNFGYDGTDCRLQVIGGVEGHPTQKVHVNRFCQPPEFGNVVLVYASFDTYFTSPLTVVWSDGVTTTQEGTPVYRIIPPLEQTTTYTIVSAHDTFCSATFDGPASVTVFASPIPDFTLGVGDICTGQTATTSLATPPPPDAQVTWFAENATIVSGQGTSSIQYTTGGVGSALIGCTFNFTDPDRCPTSTRRGLRVDAVDPGVTLSLATPQIHSGETVVLTFTVDYGVYNWYFDDSLNDPITQIGTCNHNEPCHALYTSTHGAGLSAITMHVIGFCKTKDDSMLLTILP